MNLKEAFKRIEELEKEVLQLKLQPPVQYHYYYMQPQYGQQPYYAPTYPWNPMSPWCGGNFANASLQGG